MTVMLKVLIPAKTAEDAQTTQYISPGVSTVIDKFTAINYSGSAASISVHLVTASGAASNDNIVVKSKTLQASETYTFPEIVGHILSPSGYISTIASVASAISIRASGREVT